MPRLGLEGPAARGVQAGCAGSQMTSTNQPAVGYSRQTARPVVASLKTLKELFFVVVFFVPAQNGNLLKSQKRFREWETVSHPVLASNAVFLPRKICAEERKSPRASHKRSVWNPAALWFLKNSIYICKLGRLNSHLVDWE